MKKIFWTAIIISLIIASGFYWEKLSQLHSRQKQQIAPTAVDQKAPTKNMPEQTKIANPASKYCVEHNGILIIKKLPNGGEYGVCDFGDAKYCEEWALFRGNCPIGGVKVTGYDNDAQKYCAITGGQVNMTTNTCLKDGKKCDIEKYYNGECSLK